MGSTARLGEVLPFHPQLKSQLPKPTPSDTKYSTLHARLQELKRRSPSSWDGSGVVRRFGGTATSISRKALFALACIFTVAFFASRRSLSISRPLPQSKAESSTQTEPGVDNTSHHPDISLPRYDLIEPGVLTFVSDPHQRHIASRRPPIAPSSTLTFSSLPYPESHDCLDLFVSTDTLCEALRGRYLDKRHQPQISLVWTWTNGSDPRMASWREFASSQESVKEELDGESEAESTEEAGMNGSKGGLKLDGDGIVRLHSKRDQGANVLKHFRDHDELRYSLRSVLNSIPSSLISSIRLIVSDTPDRRPPSRSRENLSAELHSRYAELPQWLKVNSEKVSLVGVDPSTQSALSLLLQPHSTIYLEVMNQGEEDSGKEYLLPTFNSASIESQLANLDLSTPEFLYLNDDTFLAQKPSISDFVTPLTGPVFRMFRDFTVDSGKIDEDQEGEWPALRASNRLLDRRFGRRRRPYLFHVAKVLSLPMLREAYRVWKEEHDRTARARFRGVGGSQIATQFLGIHYQLEKHREALLWSFLVAKTDLNHDGSHSPSERLALLSYLKEGSIYDEPSNSLYAQMPNRSSLPALKQAHLDAGLPIPLSSTFEFSSFDGYPLFASDDSFEPDIPKWPGWPSFASSDKAGGGEPGSPCALRLRTCFSESFLDPRCGDCLIIHLLAKTGNVGLEVFLPSKAAAEVTREDKLAIETIGVHGKDRETVEYEHWTGSDASIRRRAIALIQRYSYTLATSRIAFQSIRNGGEELATMLNSLSTPSDRPAFWALNDDLPSDAPIEVVEDVNRRMGNWSEKSEFEI